MKIFILTKSYTETYFSPYEQEHDNYTDILGAYTSEEAAKAARDEDKQKKRCSSIYGVSYFIRQTDLISA